MIISCTDYFRLQYCLTDVFLWCTIEREACFTLVVVLGFPSHDIFVLSLFADEVSTVATAICGLTNTNTLLKVKFRVGNSMHVLTLMLDSPREGLLFSMETVTAQPIIPATAYQSCPSSLIQTLMKYHKSCFCDWRRLWIRCLHWTEESGFLACSALGLCNTQ